MPRTLEKVSKTKDGNKFVLYENEWVNCLFAKTGDEIEVTDVSGCSAVLIWNSKNVPSVFHIFCGAQAAGQGGEGDAAKAAVIASETDCAPVHITIAADKESRYETIRDILRKKFSDRGDADLDKVEDFTPLYYDLEEVKDNLRWKFTAIAGTRKVEKTKINRSECSRQKQG